MKKLLLIFITFILISCVTSGLIKENSIGKIYENSIQLGFKTIPLPEGRWKVIGRGYKTDLGFDDYFQIVLLKETKNNKIDGILIITTETPMNKAIGYESCKYCESKNVHYIVVKNNKREDAQDCWLIGHIRVSFTKNITAIKEVYDYFLTNNIKIPYVMLHSYHRFTGKFIKSKLLVVEYYYNPEFDGFKSGSNWEPLRINKNPKKVAYIEKIIKEGTILHEKFKQGFGE